jgi:isopentenyldiphosphate isomerase
VKRETQRSPFAILFKKNSFKLILAINHMANELIDICDENNNFINIQRMKSGAHRDGLWHRAIHVWIYNSQGEILLNLRAKDKSYFPDVWDILGGHVSAGEEPIISALREIGEEVGLKVERDDLEFIFVDKTNVYYENIKNNEFHYVYFSKFDGNMDQLKIQEEEIQEIKFIPAGKIEEELKTNPDKYLPHGDYWFKMIDEIKKRTSMKEILNTTKYVVNNSRHVKINQDAIDKFVDNFDLQKINHWWNVAPIYLPDLEPEKRAMFLFLFDSISFSYWCDPIWQSENKGWQENTWLGNYNKKTSNGAWGLARNLTKAIINGDLRLEAKYLKDLDRNKFAKIVNSQPIDIPLFEQRWQITKELGKIIVEKYDSKIINLMKEARGDGKKLFQIIVDDFPFFEDRAVYHNQRISFYKRAQLLVADLIQCLGPDWNMSVNELNKFTACADYKLPQVLRQLEILKYSSDLSYKIDHKIRLAGGSEEEVEIRANTIQAVEIIKEKLRLKNIIISSNAINDYLWLLGQDDVFRLKPYHRTRTIAY